MILGDICTRHCTFCGVSKSHPLPLDESEPERVALAARSLRIDYCVVTSVTRDDLESGGAPQFARTVSTVREVAGARVEVLTPDFGGDERSLEIVLDSSPEVFGHNIETVPRLYQDMRPEADYRVSIGLLKRAKRDNVITKSGLILGLGERPDEVIGVMEDLSECGTEIITLGQYLPPTAHHPPAREYVHPDQFHDYRRRAMEIGFKVAFSGPFVRSSYKALEAYGLCLA